VYLINGGNKRPPEKIGDFDTVEYENTYTYSTSKISDLVQE